MNMLQSRRWLVILILIILTIPTLLPFFNSRFFYSQDHIFIARLQQMSTALLDGHFPARWALDLRFGEPLFNFYAPLPYYIGAVIKLLGFNFIWVSKILFILSSILSSLSMYLFCRKFFNSWSSLFAAILYTYAPYRAVDIYVRGALSEAFSFIFFPIIFYASYLLSERVNLKRVSLLALSLAGLFLTHNVTALSFLPFLIFWWIYLMYRQRQWKIILPLVASSIVGLGLAAFFLLPALFERQFIQTKYLIVGYFDFRAHFVAFYQFFSPFWGYGSSLWGPKDDMSFQIGLIHWVVLALAILLGIILRKRRQLLILLSFLLLSFFISLFLQHNKSAFVWEAIPLMAFIQFPWRFLSISIFVISIIAAVVAEHLKGKFTTITFILMVMVIAVNLPYFRPRNFVDDSFFDKFLHPEIMHQGVDLTKDYFPIWVENDRVEYFDSPRVLSGEIEILNFEKKTAHANGVIKVVSNALIEVPITYFPGWEVRANGQVLNLSNPTTEGLITLELPPGQYQIDLELKDTPVRMIGNAITLISILFLLVFLGYKKFRYES